MNDCTNVEMRDLLPALARGALTGPALVAVEGHLATCASCRAELALVRTAQAVLGVAPPVDASRIAAAVVRSGGIRREATMAVAHARRRRVWSSTPSRRAWLAAASVVAVVGAAVLATSVARKPGPSELPPVVIEMEEPSAPTPAPPAPSEAGRSTTPPAARAELVMGGGVGELADADLESLLGVLDGLDAQLDVEPAALPTLLEGDV